MLDINLNTAYSRLRLARAAFELAVRAQGSLMPLVNLSPSTRARCSMRRVTESPPEAATWSRVRGKIDAAITGGGSATAASGMSLAVKLSMFSVIALVVGGAVLLRGDRAAATSPSLDLAAPAVVDVPAAARAHEGPPPVMHFEMGGEIAAVPRLVANPELPVRGIDLAREVQLVDAAMTRFVTGDAQGAIMSVRLHRAETADRGQLSEDAAAIVSRRSAASRPSRDSRSSRRSTSAAGLSAALAPDHQLFSRGDTMKQLAVLAALAGCHSSVVVGDLEDVTTMRAVANRDLDILFVIDNSGSMAEQQASLAANFPRMIDVLEQLDGGLPNLHIGVTTSDMGSSTTTGAKSPRSPAMGTIGNGGCGGTATTVRSARPRP